MNTEPVKGFRDFSGNEAENRAEMRKIIVRTFERYGFEPAETPLIEQEEFVRGENNNDEAVSDTFRLQDKGKRNLALRYEFTFQLKRLMKNKKLPYKRYQMGEVFRDEPISSNRFRQFTQCDVDVVGSTVKNEAEILAMTSELMKDFGIDSVILVNNRGLLNEILDDLGIKKEKEKVLREIDKYDKIGEKETKINLKKLGAEKVIDALKQGEDYFNQFQGYKEIVSLMEYCRIYGTKVLFSPTLVRGLSYYNGDVFEVKAKGIKETLVAGGSYIFEGIQCTGISFGLNRLAMTSKLKFEREKYLVVSLGEDEAAISLAQRLREKNRGKDVTVYYGKPSKALDYANSYSFTDVIFVGEKEVKAKKFKIKNMRTGKESALKL